jgi:hypothetical protein
MKLVRNAEAAFLASIEIYNKPTFSYREESFSILILNAWELLVKARVLFENGDRITSLYVRERRRLASGKLSTKEYVKLNRAGNPLTASLHEAITRLTSPGSRVTDAIRLNLEALIAIRDNAIHYVNTNGALAKTVYEIGTASVRNFVDLSKTWFNLNLARHPLYLMPLAFIVPESSAEPMIIGVGQKHLLEYLAKLVEGQTANAADPFHVSLDVKVGIQRTSISSNAAVYISDSPEAVPIVLSEEDIRQRYPWSYKDLVERLKERFADFKENNDFHNIRRPILNDTKLVKHRLLDPGNPKSSKKTFYSPNIIREFETHYTRRLGG